MIEAYVARARAYNGMCTVPVTADGAKVPKVLGAVRAGSPVAFPTESVALTELVPDFDKYTGYKPDYGRMETTASDPSVYQQYGMVVGIPNARQVNALEVLNIRGERSVTCKGAYDAPPGTPLPAGAPAACEEFRKQPDALETAAAFDAMYGRNPDLEAMPMYCVAMANKGIYDAKDMRTTGGADVNYAMDAPPKDSTLVARLREAGAIIYAQAHESEYNAGSGDPGGDAKVERPYIGQGGSRESWGGTTCNPYDTAARHERLERRFGRRRRGEPRDVLDLRDHRRLVPRPCQLPRRRAGRADQGHDLVRRLHRCASLSGSPRHHLPYRHGRRDGSRCVPRQDDGQRSSTRAIPTPRCRAWSSRRRRTSMR